MVGVLEPTVPYPVATEIIANVVTSPHHLSATMVQGREHRMTEVFARLAPGATLEAARSELNTVYGAMKAAHPEVYKAEDHYQIQVTRMHDQINSRANTILWLLFAASGLLFVIASSNVANLVLARTVRRESELATRSALGASTTALRRSLLAESLVLCVSGAIAAILLAIPMVAVLGQYAARFSVRAQGLKLDFSLVWFGVALALAAAVFLAFIPRLPSATGTQGGLNGRGARVAGSGTRRLRAFAVAQIAASFLLLTGACVLMKTLFTLEQMRPPLRLGAGARGESSGDVVWQDSAADHGVLPGDSAARGALPGVEQVAQGFSVPWRDDRALSISFSFAASGAHRPDGQDFRAAFPRGWAGLFRDDGHADPGGTRLQRWR